MLLDLHDSAHALDVGSQSPTADAGLPGGQLIAHNPSAYPWLHPLQLHGFAQCDLQYRLLLLLDHLSGLHLRSVLVCLRCSDLSGGISVGVLGVLFMFAAKVWGRTRTTVSDQAAAD